MMRISCKGKKMNAKAVSENIVGSCFLTVVFVLSGRYEQIRMEQEYVFKNSLVLKVDVM